VSYVVKEVFMIKDEIFLLQYINRETPDRSVISIQRFLMKPLITGI